MRINKIDNTLNFNAGMGGLSKALYTLSNNDMLNASFVDVFAMDTPRTIVETKNRGKQAGIEMGFREYTGTFIAEFSAALFAVIASKFIAKKLSPDVKVNSGSWITNNGLDVFSDIYNKSDKTPESYVKNVLNSMSGLKGKEIKEFSDIDKEKTNYITERLTKLITDNNPDKKQTKKVLNQIQDDIINLMGADNNITIKGEKKSLSANLTHTLRDIVDSGKNIFFGMENKKEPSAVISKLKRMNNLRIGIMIKMLRSKTKRNQKKACGGKNFYLREFLF